MLALLSDRARRDVGMDRVLEGKVAVVSGASRGIGRATALLFARQGAQLVLNSTTDAGVERIVADVRALGAEAIGVRADVGVRGEAEALIAAAEDRFGRVDVLVNNAGVYTLGPILPPWEIPDADWDRLLAINLTSVFTCTRAAIRGMLERRSGAIVNVTSLAAQAVRPISVAPYSAAKAGVIGFT